MSDQQKIEFRQLLDDENYREKECVPFLEHAVGYLLKQTPMLLRRLRMEERSFFGRSDYIISADLKNDYGAVDTVAEIWEAKAPQCVLMESDDAADRYRPTKSLLKAETQLIHYVAQAQGDRTFQARYKIVQPENVRMGGIIIGQDKTIVDSTDPNEIEAARVSFRIRQTSIYGQAKIRVMTWDRIADLLL